MALCLIWMDISQGFDRQGSLSLGKWKSAISRDSGLDITRVLGCSQCRVTSISAQELRFCIPRKCFNWTELSQSLDEILKGSVVIVFTLLDLYGKLDDIGDSLFPIFRWSLEQSMYLSLEWPQSCNGVLGDNRWTRMVTKSNGSDWNYRMPATNKACLKDSETILNGRLTT